MNKIDENQMTTVAQRMERQFFLNLIRLVNEVQNDRTTLKSQFNSNRKSTWIKQTKNPKQDKSALAGV